MDIEDGGLVRATRWTTAGDGAREGLGVAVDVGTTTLVARLYDLATGARLASASRPNTQARWGADVISRIAACGKGHLGDMTAAVREGVDGMVADMLAVSQGMVQRDRYFAPFPVQSTCPSAPSGIRSFVCGNTVMEHLFAGVDPTPIGLAPFAPPHLRDFPCETEALTLAPCVAGYVGGDIVCDLLALDLGFPSEGDGPALLLDLGTNGEVALAAGGRIITCATAAGPVFEGAQISCGMPAYEGAVRGVRRGSDGALAVETVGDVPADEAVGICGSGLVDAIALMIREGIIDARGRWADTGVPAAERRFAITPRVSVTQKDVRAFQLAKAAIAAGVKVLLDEAGITTGDLAHVYVAGGLGTHLDLANARTAGLIPSGATCPVIAAGNTAIEGAALALLSPDAAAFARQVAATCEYVELSGSAAFNAHYLASMDF